MKIPPPAHIADRRHPDLARRPNCPPLTSSASHNRDRGLRQIPFHQEARPGVETVTRSARAAIASSPSISAAPYWCGWLALGETSRHHQHAAVRQGCRGRIPASPVHRGQRLPLFRAPVEQDGVLHPHAVAKWPPTTSRRPSGRKAWPEQNRLYFFPLARSIGCFVGRNNASDVARTGCVRIPELRRALLLVHGAVGPVAPSPEQDISVWEQMRMNRHVRHWHHRIPSSG